MFVDWRLGWILSLLAAPDFENVESGIGQSNFMYNY